MTNIYPTLLSKGNPKLLGYLEKLDKDGQIDHDENGEPVVTDVDNIEAGLLRVRFLRDGTQENFLLNTRKRPNSEGYVEPLKISWDSSDGFVRPDDTKEKIAPKDKSGGERALRSYRDMAESIIRGKANGD